MFISWKDWIIVKTDVLFNEKTRWRGIGGRELVLDTRFDAERHCRKYGEVVSTPKALSHIPIIQQHRGLPSYHSYVPFRYKFLDDIVPEVQVGDRIYFHFNVIMNAIKQNSFVDVQGVHPNRTWFIKCRYDQVFCAVRAGEIIMIGGNTLIDPDFESWADILVPTYSELKDKFGKPILKPKEQWIQKKEAPTYKHLLGFVRHIGTPLLGEKREVFVGQRIYYHRGADWIQAVEGRDYFTIHQRHIVGREETTLKIA